MSAPSTPSWLLAASRRRAGYGNLRVSDGERAEVADLLSKHYADGRLDQAEFEQRMDLAMHAKTYSDLNGLFDDLPQTGPGGPLGPPATGPGQPWRQHHAHPAGRGLLLVALIVVVAVTAGHAIAWSFTPWLWFGPWVWIALLVLVAVYVTRHRRGRP
jgi:Flp pilus assembly protein TadB